jgi:hypothetical protein
MAYAHTKGESIWRRRLLFSVLIAGAISVPVWRMVQLARAESNSLVKRRGSGVGVTSMVAVGAGVSVKGTGVSEEGIVAVGGRVEVGVAAAGWQATRKINAMRRGFFMALITACGITR